MKYSDTFLISMDIHMFFSFQLHLFLKLRNCHRISFPSTNNVGPSLSIGIVTYATFDIWNYAAYAMAVNTAFAEFNGNYLFKLLDPNTTSGNFDYYDSRWNKVSILRDAIHPEHGWYELNDICRLLQTIFQL